MSTDYTLNAATLGQLARLMQGKPYYQTQMALAAASGTTEIDLPAYMVNQEAERELKVMRCLVERAGAFFRVSWRHMLALVLVGVVLLGSVSPALAQAPTAPVASDEAPMTDEQREAIAFRELPTMDDALTRGAWTLRVAERLGWTVAVLIVVALVWWLLCLWAAALGRAVHPPQRVPDDDFEAAAFRESRDEMRRRYPRRLLSQVDESRLDLRNW